MLLLFLTYSTLLLALNFKLSLPEIYQAFIEGMKETTWLEYIAVFSGIASVWFSRKENIWVYPTGLINTIFYVYLSFKGSLLGEAKCKFLLYRYEYLWLDIMGKKKPTTEIMC